MALRLLLVAGMLALLAPVPAWAATDVNGKVVLANMDRYPVTLKIGSSRRDVQPKKASVVTPKAFPVTIEYWSGNSKAGWQKKTIVSAGVYGFNFQRGYWSLAELKKGITARATPPARRTVVRQPS